VDHVDYVFTDREGVAIGKEGGEYVSIVDIEGEIYGIYIYIVCMCVCVFTYVYMCKYIRIYTYIRINIHTYIHL
jgi:hypothetical protein